MTKSDYTHLALIVDRSGSMASTQNDMEGAIKNLLKEQAEEPGGLLVDIWTFDTIVDHPYEDAEAQDITGQIIEPRGGTALNDAIGKCVVELGERFAAMSEDQRPGVVIVAVVTDGQENSSQEYPGTTGRDAVKALVEKQKDQFGWTFLFFGADSIDAFAAAEGYGIGRGQTVSYVASPAGAAGASFAASSMTSRARRGESSEATEAERAAAAGEG